MKLSKSAKKRLKRLNMSERKAVEKAAFLLAEKECITAERYEAIRRALKSTYGGIN